MDVATMRYELGDIKPIVNLTYSELYRGDLPDLKDEIRNLNVDRAISIICELLHFGFKGTADHNKAQLLLKMLFLKQEHDNIVIDSKYFSSGVYITSPHFLMVLLKKVLAYGEIKSENDGWTVCDEDYVEIIKLQLIVADEIDLKQTEEFDSAHYIYSIYQLYQGRAIANDFIRMHYMLDVIAKDDSFLREHKKPKDYNHIFEEKYGVSPIDYLYVLFWQLNFYEPAACSLLYKSSWIEIEDCYKDDKLAQKATGVFPIVSETKDVYRQWATSSDDNEWDFSEFYSYPFIKNSKGRYISISRDALENAFFAGLYWKIRHCYPLEASRSMDFFGKIFEEYVQRITIEAVVDPYEFIDEFYIGSHKDGDRSSDTYIRNGNKLLIVEAKSYLPLLNALKDNDDESVSKNKGKLFIDPINQAKTFLDKLIESKHDLLSGIDEVYIISLTMGGISAVPDYYNSIINEITAGIKTDLIKGVFNLSIEEYEKLLALMEYEYDIFALLKEYYENAKLVPFNAFVGHYNSDIIRTKFMNAYYAKLCGQLKTYYGITDL